MCETFEVLLWGGKYTDDLEVRNVRVEDPDEDTWGLLEQIFYYGQNEICPNPSQRSVSVGDIVKIDDQCYICEAVGWTCVSNGKLLGVS